MIDKETFVNYLSENNFIFLDGIYSKTKGLDSYSVFGRKIFKNIVKMIEKNLYNKFFEIDTTNLIFSKILKGSGHVDRFLEKYIICKKCNKLLKIDEKFFKICPSCSEIIDENQKIYFKELLFSLETKFFLRPETTQNMINYIPNLFRLNRCKYPLGIYQIGKGFRKEIAKKIFERMYEFWMFEFVLIFDTISEENFKNNFKLFESHGFITKKEYDFFFKFKFNFEKDSKIGVEFLKVINNDILSFFIYKNLLILSQIGFNLEECYIHKQKISERAHYSVETYDIMVRDRDSNRDVELIGISNRANNDLVSHNQYSHERIFEEKKFLKNLKIYEASIGLDRIFFYLLKKNFIKNSSREYFLLPFNICCYHFSINSLVNNNKILKKVDEIYDYYKNNFEILKQIKGSIGKKYYTSDKLGIFYSLTVDYESVETDTITVRKITDKSVERMKYQDLSKYLQKNVFN